MQCAACGKSGFVTLGNKQFCSSCGAVATNATVAAPPATPAETTQSPSQTTPTPTTTEQSVKSSANMLDLRKNALSPAKGTQRVLKTATDLRPVTPPRPVTTIEQPAAPQISTIPTPPAPTPGSVTPPTPAQPAAPAPAPTPEPEPQPQQQPQTQPTASIAPTGPKAASTAVAPTPPQPTSAAAPEPPAPTTQRSPLLTKIPPHPAIATAPTPPQSTLTQIDAMQVQAATAPEPPKPPQSPALQQALQAAKQSTATSSLVKVGAGVAAIAIMTTVIWFQNSPKLAFHNAATKAGVAASLPTYMPSSYRQQGDAKVSPGQLTLSFASPSSAEPLTITQRRSDWDSESLKQNYVTQQNTNALAVQGQGLTIYLYGDKASWINHGVWYEVSGATKLSREQVLKIAYGL